MSKKINLTNFSNRVSCKIEKSSVSTSRNFIAGGLSFLVFVETATTSTRFVGLNCSTIFTEISAIVQIISALMVKIMMGVNFSLKREAEACIDTSLLS